jgi:hypothetical protein
MYMLNRLSDVDLTTPAVTVQVKAAFFFFDARHGSSCKHYMIENLCKVARPPRSEPSQSCIPAGNQDGAERHGGRERGRMSLTVALGLGSTRSGVPCSLVRLPVVTNVSLAMRGVLLESEKIATS